MRRLTATGATHVGRVREGNEDAYLVAQSVFAVADGMGGHLAGEIASAKALEPVEALDGKVYPDAQGADDALRAAIVTANETVSRLAEQEPSYRGMGTTLTAAMLEGQRLHLAHVGDSRAYLLRGDRFNQLTDDHTLVQHLIDEGQITKEEAATHPQRSIITRAIGVSHDIEVDSMTIDIEPGDQIMLCSDGLTGVLDDDYIADELRSDDDAEAVIERLIDAANQRGGPDNITVVLLRCDPESLGEPHPSQRGGGAAAVGTAERGAPQTGERRSRGAPVAIRTQQDTDSGNWAGRLHDYGSAGRVSPRNFDRPDEPRPRRWIGRLLATLLALGVIGGIVFVGGNFLLSQQYFVGLDEEQVVIYQGVDVAIGSWSLATIVERTDLSLDEIPVWFHAALEEGVSATDRVDARRIVAGAPRLDDPEEPNGATTSDDAPTTSDDTSPGPSAGEDDPVGSP